jgi:AmmeMemoRadiSam system protein A
VNEPLDAPPNDAPSPEERGVLLRVAREAIAARLGGSPLSLPDASGTLAARRGAFVTLRARGDDELRGCIGQMESERPLVETVARMAVAAATEDTRFRPVTLGELVRLKLEISVLGPMRSIRAPEVVVGRHGLMVSDGRRRGVLLPQVPVEQGWERETFLAHTCIKAGLPADAWRKPGVELLAFTADVFGED